MRLESNNLSNAIRVTRKMTGEMKCDESKTELGGGKKKCVDLCRES